MKRNLMILIMTICLSMSLAACGGSKDNPENETNSSKVQSESISDERTSDTVEKNTEADGNEVSSEEQTSEQEEFSPIDVQGEGEIELDEDETFVIQ